MLLTGLTLQNFRSYTKRTFNFSKTTTVILGPNTAGKTNILEGIFLASTGKSFRAELEREMIRQGQEIARVKIKNQKSKIKNDTNEDIQELEVILTLGEVAGHKAPIKRYFVNSVARRQVDFVGNLKTVLFWPQDLELITDSPTQRRRYLDFVLVQVDREYRRSLLSYEKGIRQRNRVLEHIRDGLAKRSQLLFWDQLLIRTGSYLTQKRQNYIEFINKSLKPFGNFSIDYDLSVISESRLRLYQEEEIAAAATLVGPHRDDLIFFEAKRDLSKFGSRGEQRLTILWLKLAELASIEKETEEKPVLLLDDIFSELDHAHRDEVVRIVGNQQTIITTTDQHFLPQSLAQQAEIIELRKSVGGP